MSLAKRTFSGADQERFAAASGDRNPMHMDAVQARRTQAGAPVVHGIHMLLWALDSFAAGREVMPALRGVRARFDKFVYLGEEVEAVLAREGPTGARVNVCVDGGARSSVTMEFGEAVEGCPEWAGGELEGLPLSAVASTMEFEQMAGRSGRVGFAMTEADAAAQFPAATKWLGARRVAAIAASTYLVGMVLPGLHSIYSELSVRACEDAEGRDGLAFRVTETDERFRTVEEEIAGGGVRGTVRSFARNPPVEQATMKSLRGVVGEGEFAGSVALVVGGSRGLGELRAKLIATGGGSVVITWKAGREDAERVAEEIRAAGGACETLAYDAQRPAAEQLAGLREAPTHGYFFATPAIARAQAEVFVAERLRDFLGVYVEGFWQLAQELRAKRAGVSLFYPSSIFVTERPKKMTEYAMAKAAGEVLCADMNAALAPLHVTVSRLPRLPTDQTSSFLENESADPLATLLPLVREVQSWPR